MIKKSIKILLLFLVLVLFLRCEQIDVIESDIPFTEVNIVNGRLIGDSSEVSISFTKSFPIEKDLTLEDVALENVTAYIWSKNQGVYPLQHVGEGNYKPTDILKINPGESYELYAKINDERIFAETYVPRYPTIKEAKIQGDYINCKILPNSHTVYGTKYKISSLDQSCEVFEEKIFYEVSNVSTDTTQAVEIKTSSLPIQYFEEPEKYYISLTLYAFDENYKAYFATRENNKPIENIFSEGGGSVYWNIQGENSIGMFIAYSKLTLFDIK